MRNSTAKRIRKFMVKTGMHLNGKYNGRQLNNIYRQVKKHYVLTGRVEITEGMLQHVKYL